MDAAEHIEERAETLRDELESARRDSIAAGIRFRLLVHDSGADLMALAEAAEACSLQSGRVAGLARLVAVLSDHH